MDSPSKLRKGTKSCTECRRRKVRCSWDSDSSVACRRCIERGSNCVAQTTSLPANGVRKLSSRQRISQLEAELAKINKRVYNLESKKEPFPIEDVEVELDEEEDEEDSSDESQVVIQDRPSHLKSLFQNEWISTENTQFVSISQNNVRLLDIARKALQSLIPSKEDVSIISGYVAEWVTLVDSLFPFTYAAKNQHQVLSSYEMMIKSNVDTMSLASWLLMIAITSQHVPQETFSPNTMMSVQKRQTFGRRVATVLERSIISHDSLIGTVEGLEVAVTFLRFQMTRGNFHKSWLTLRRVLAIAELIGLPRAHRTLGSTQLLSEEEQKTRNAKIHLWDSICFIDRFAGVLNNLPSATQRYSLSTDEPLVADGVVHVRPYLLKLGDIALKIHDFDDLIASEGSNVALYAAVLRLDGDLRILASSVPNEWWTSLPKGIDAQNIIQFFHYVITMRVHLPFSLRNDPREEYSYSRDVGINACKAVAHRWLDIRSRLPSGFFTCRIIDVQAFTAAVVLLLSSYANQRNDELLDDIMKLMEEKSKEPVNFDYAQQAVDTIKSLRAILQRGTPDQDLKVTVPLLGKIHIRRKVDLTQPPVMDPSLFNEDFFQWSVENDFEGMFQTHVMAEDEMFGGWDNLSPYMQT